MALDLMTAPPMSSEPEQIFSLTGLLLIPNRARLQSDIIGASIAVGSWNKEAIIKTVDGQLRRPRKEGTEIHGRMVTQHRTRTRDRPILTAGATETTVGIDLGVAR